MYILCTSVKLSVIQINERQFNDAHNSMYFSKMPVTISPTITTTSAIQVNETFQDKQNPALFLNAQNNLTIIQKIITTIINKRNNINSYTFDIKFAEIIIKEFCSLKNFNLKRVVGVVVYICVGYYILLRNTGARNGCAHTMM